MLGEDRAPKTINRRVSSVSSFYRYLAGVASEARLPITVPNPAHAQFIARMTSDPVNATKALSATRARQLMGLPTGETPTAFDQHNSQLRKLLKYALADKTHDLRHGRLGKYSVVFQIKTRLAARRHGGGSSAAPVDTDRQVLTFRRFPDGMKTTLTIKGTGADKQDNLHNFGVAADAFNFAYSLFGILPGNQDRSVHPLITLVPVFDHVVIQRRAQCGTKVDVRQAIDRVERIDDRPVDLPVIQVMLLQERKVRTGKSATGRMGIVACSKWFNLGIRGMGRAFEARFPEIMLPHVGQVWHELVQTVNPRMDVAVDKMNARGFTGHGDVGFTGSGVQ